MLTPSRLIEGVQVSASAGALYIASTKTVITRLTVKNTSASAVKVTIYLVPANGAVGVASNCWEATLGPGQSKEAYEAEHVLETGDMLSAFAGTANCITLMASGVLIS